MSSVTALPIHQDFICRRITRNRDEFGILAIVRKLVWMSLSILGTAHAQSFEAVSIKFHPEPILTSADPSVRGATVWATASTLLDMITVAYNLRYDQVSGGPKWIGSDHYDLLAKA